MTTTTSAATVQEWADTVNSGEALQQALGLTSCDTLHTLFPAIVGDDAVMSALADMLEPAFPVIAALESHGIVGPGEGAEVAHSLFHMLQIVAGLGHMLGVADALGMADSLPDLDSIAWGDLPDFTGDTDTTTTADAATTTTPDQSGESEES